MADLPSSKVKINDIEVAQEAALSESFFSKVGSSINALIDDTNTNAANVASAISVNNTQDTRLTNLEAVRLTRITVSGSVSFVAPPETIVWQSGNILIQPTPFLRGVLWSRSRQAARVITDSFGNPISTFGMLSAYQSYGLGTCTGSADTNVGPFRIELRRTSDNALFQTLATLPTASPLTHVRIFNHPWELNVQATGVISSPTNFYLRYIGDYSGSSSATAITFTDYEMYFSQF
jgi:hypothetical protein